MPQHISKRSFFMQKMTVAEMKTSNGGLTLGLECKLCGFITLGIFEYWANKGNLSCIRCNNNTWRKI